MTYRRRNTCASIAVAGRPPFLLIVLALSVSGVGYDWPEIVSLVSTSAAKRLPNK